MKKFAMVLTVLFFLVACSPAKTSLESAILGNWESADGFRIEFHPDGKGFIPGVEDKIPDSNFQYTITDGQHVTIDMGGQKYSIEIQIVSDTLIWNDALGQVSYHKVK